MQINAVITLKKTSEILSSLLNDVSFSQWKKQELETYAKELMVTNDVLIKIIDIDKLKLSILTDIAQQHGDVEYIEYCIVNELLKHKEKLPTEIVVGLESEWASETIEPIYPAYNLKVMM